jgi:uncharacterized membrane protein YkoI
MFAALLAMAMNDTDHASADERRGEDHDAALQALKSGKTLPLAEVLALIRAKIDGEIIETDFEYDRGAPVYEFKYVNSRGQVREAYVDARTGRILRDTPD